MLPALHMAAKRKTVFGPEHPSTLTSMANLASTYRNQGRWTEAEYASDEFKTVLGPEHPSTLTSMANLAFTLRNQGRCIVVEKLFVQVMKISKTVLGPEHPVTLMTMWNLSHTLKKLRRHAQALSFKLVFGSKTDDWVPPILILLLL